MVDLWIDGAEYEQDDQKKATEEGLFFDRLISSFMERGRWLLGWLIDGLMERSPRRTIRGGNRRFVEHPSSGCFIEKE